MMKTSNSLRQIFNEVYSDIVEKYINKKEVTGKTYFEIVQKNISSSAKEDVIGKTYFEIFNGDILGIMDYVGKYGKVRYLKRMIKHVRKTDDDFRWLSIMPVKRNEVDKTTGKKVKPYLAYKYVNINATKTPELLEQVNAIWTKHAESCLKGLDKKIKRIEAIKQMTSTPEGQARQRKARDDRLAFIELCLMRDSHLVSTDNKNIDRMVGELKEEGRLPAGEDYKTNHERLRTILHEEVTSEEAFYRLSDEERKPKQMYKLMKDTIVAYFNPKNYEVVAAEPAKEEEYNDWESLTYNNKQKERDIIIDKNNIYDNKKI
jgi:hypothetical protein